MLTKVTALEKLGGYRLRVSFNDRNGGVHDFTAMAHEPGTLLAPLRDPAISIVYSWNSAHPLSRTALTSRRNGCGVKWNEPVS